MIDLNQVRIFERVAARSSFAAAARELGLPRSNVSRAVASLEQSLGTRLLHRTTREVALTPAGTALFERAEAIMADLNQAIAYIGELRGTPSGPLRISAGIGLGINVLSTHLPRFAQRYPKVEIDLRLESNRVDLLTEGVDVALRFGELSDSSLVARRLGAIPRDICASREYLAQTAKLAAPDDLSIHRIVDMPTLDGRPRPWRLYRDGEERKIELKPMLTVDDAVTAYRFVLNGAGIGIVSQYLCEQDLASGRLLRPLREWSVPPVPLYLVYPSKRELAPAVRAFSDFLNEIEPLTPWRREAGKQDGSTF
jgi:LysR family transcriptional regulator, regulator for bpeEF and oprC